MILRDKDDNSSQEKETSESEENIKIENQEKVLTDQLEVWEKIVPSHKVIRKEEKFESKLEKILLSEQPLDLLFCKGTHKFFLKSHEGELMGQLGVDKTLELLKGKSFWPPMRKDVQRHYHRCISCLKTNSKTMSLELYAPLPFASAPWEDISIDFILELPRTTKGFDSTLVLLRSTW